MWSVVCQICAIWKRATARVTCESGLKSAVYNVFRVILERYVYKILKLKFVKLLFYKILIPVKNTFESRLNVIDMIFLQLT